MLIDIYLDENMEVFKEKLKSTPDVIPMIEKIASVELEDRDDVSENAFAWPEEKMYPIYTPELALISSVYVSGEDAPEFVKQACENACIAFGMDISIDGLQKTASIEAEQLTMDDFLIPDSQKLPVVDRDTAIKSRIVLEKVASDLSVDNLIYANRTLVKKASEYGIEVSDKERALGLYGHIKKNDAIAVAYDRFMHTGDKCYTKLASDIPEGGAFSLEKIASFVRGIAEADERNGVSESIKDTILSVITPSDKNYDTISISGEDIDVKKIASLKADDISDMFGERVASVLSDEAGNIDVDSFSDFMSALSDEEQEIMLNKLKEI